MGTRPGASALRARHRRRRGRRRQVPARRASSWQTVRSRVVRGRCLPYGEGITYWPVVEVLKQLDLLPPDEAAAAAIRSLLGESDAATSAEEIAWAFRKTLEHAAAERAARRRLRRHPVGRGDVPRPDRARRAPLERRSASSCSASPGRSSAERHPTWPVTLRLEPLGDDDVEALIPRRRIAELLRAGSRARAGGNPLFIEEMLAMSGEATATSSFRPPCRRCSPRASTSSSRRSGACSSEAAIEGEIFHRGAVQALAPEEPQVTPRLAALVRKELIRPDRPQLADDDGFRFRHLLIRDAAYDALPKAVARDLHVASQLGSRSTARSSSSSTRSSATTLEQASLSRRARPARRRRLAAAAGVA